MDPKKNAVHKVVRCEGLLEATSTGWTLIDSFEADGVVEYDDYVAPTADDRSRNLGYVPMSGIIRRKQIGKVRLFLVQLDEASVLTELQNKIDMLEAAERSYREKGIKADEEKKALEASLKKATSDHEWVRAEMVRVNQRSDRLAETSRRMEEELGKLRESLGTDRFNEIVKR